MRKIWIALVLAIAVCFSGIAVTAEPTEPEAMPVRLAAQPFDPTSLSGMLSYTCDAQTGEWSVGADAFEAVLDQARRGGTSDLLLMQFKWIGNARTGWLQPLLELYYFGGNKLEADAISIRVGEVRYDVQALCESVKVGSRSAERIWAPLTQNGMRLLNALNSADAYSLRIHGARTRSADVKRRETGTDARKKLISASFACFAMPDVLDMAEYRLWDQSAAAWKVKYGFEPRTDVIPLSEEKGFEMLSPGNSGEKVRMLQKQLIEHVFLMGNPGSTYGEQVREAVLRAQKHSGLMQTGSADRQLTDRLSGQVPNKPIVLKEEKALAQLGSTSLCLDRYWFAQKVEPSIPSTNGLQGEAVSNMDNLFAVFDGIIQNNGASTLSLDAQLKGTLYLNDHPFGCIILCERDKGAAFDTQLLPQARARLIVLAEIPGNAITKDICLELSINNLSKRWIPLRQ